MPFGYLFHNSEPQPCAFRPSPRLLTLEKSEYPLTVFPLYTSTIVADRESMKFFGFLIFNLDFA